MLPSTKLYDIFIVASFIYIRRLSKFQRFLSYEYWIVKISCFRVFFVKLVKWGIVRDKIYR